jgi:hypothetical protein
MNDAELFKKLLYIPLEVDIPLSLKGHFNDQDGRLRVDGYFPKIKYNDTSYESVTLFCENPADEFNCRLRGSMLMNSGAMLTVALDATADNDRIKTTVNWGNNTDVTYGGRVSAVARFSMSKGKSPLLQTDIDILPTKVVLNDRTWDIRSSHVALDSGRVFVNNFLIERPDQYLRIDGRITKEVNDSCIVELKNVDCILLKRGCI